MKRSGEIFDPDTVKDCSLMEVKEAIDHISNHFRLPLEVRGVSICSLLDEADEISSILLGSQWYRVQENLVHIVYLSQCKKVGPNMLNLFQLSFCLPFSNGRVEQMFYSLKALKMNRRNALSNGHVE